MPEGYYCPSCDSQDLEWDPAVGIPEYVRCADCSWGAEWGQKAAPIYSREHPLRQVKR